MDSKVDIVRNLKVDLPILPETLSIPMRVVTVSNTIQVDDAWITFKRNHFSDVKSLVSSPTFFISNLPWRLEVSPTEKQTANEKHLSFYLRCVQDSSSNKSWGCFGEFELVLVNQKDTSKTISKKYTRSYNKSTPSWGFLEFVNWSKLTNPENGFIMDDTIIFRVHLKRLSPIMEI